jgi:hypothetical protein
MFVEISNDGREEHMEEELILVLMGVVVSSSLPSTKQKHENTNKKLPYTIPCLFLLIK